METWRVQERCCKATRFVQTFGGDDAVEYFVDGDGGGNKEATIVVAGCRPVNNCGGYEKGEPQDTRMSALFMSENLAKALPKSQ